MSRHIPLIALLVSLILILFTCSQLKNQSMEEAGVPVSGELPDFIQEHQDKIKDAPVEKTEPGIVYPLGGGFSDRENQKHYMKKKKEYEADRARSQSFEKLKEAVEKQRQEEKAE